MTKKESDLQRLKEELMMKEIACAKYEEMLKKQRKDLLRQIDK
jgi:5-azacytidine-induced protein 1